MASIRKSFNFRNGVQVDEDNFVVNANGLVGIGTSVPREVLDVVGNIKSNQNITSNDATFTNLNVIGIQTAPLISIEESLQIGVTSISSGIITSNTGVVTYYGDGGRLLNLPTSQWLDVDVGLGFTSIYAQGFVGIATNDPRYVFQVGGNYTNLSNPASLINGVGIDSLGNISATGVITAFAFDGNGTLLTDLVADNVTSGTLSTDRLPSNISIGGSFAAEEIYANVKFVGVGSEITLIDAGNVTLGSLDESVIPDDINFNSINSNYINVSISSTLSDAYATSLGIGTLSQQSDINIRSLPGEEASIRITSPTDESNIVLGRSSTSLDTNGGLRFGNTNSLYDFSTINSFDIINYDIGNLNFYNNLNGGSGYFNWIFGASNEVMTLTPDGRLGIGITLPEQHLHVVGASTVTTNHYVGGDLFVFGDANFSNATLSGGSFIANTIGIKTSNAIYDFQIGGDPTTDEGIGINEDGRIYTSSSIELITNINASGIITSTGFDAGSGDIDGNTITGNTLIGNGSQVTNINANNIISGTLDNIRLEDTVSVNQLNVVGVITANSGVDAIDQDFTTTGDHVGIGSLLTNLDASNIDKGTLDNDRLPQNISVTGSVSADTLSATGLLSVNELSVNNVSVAETITTTDINVSGSIIAGTLGISSGLTFNQGIGLLDLEFFYNSTTNELQFSIDDPAVGIVSTRLTLS